MVNFTKELDYPTIKLDVKLDSLPDVRNVNDGFEVVVDIKVHDFYNNNTFYTDSNGLRMMERVVATGNLSAMSKKEKQGTYPYYRISQGPGSTVTENYYPVTGIIMMYDIKNITLARDQEDEGPHRMLKNRKPVNPDEFVTLEEGKKLFEASFGEEIEEK